MSYFAFYSIFAITTGFAALYELFWPVVKKLMAENPELEVSKRPKLVTTSLFCISVLIAPLVFLSCILPSYSERFRVRLYEQLKTTEKF